MSSQLELIAQSFEPKIRNSLLAAFAELKDSVSMAEIERAMRNGGVNAVFNILNDLQIEGVLEKNIVDELNVAITESGRVTFNSLPVGAKTGLVFRYNLINPLTSQYVRNYELDLIGTISNTTRQAIRNNIEAGVISGANPRTVARNFRSTIGLTTKQELAVRNYQKALENRSKNALDRALRDKRFDSTVARSIKEDIPLTKAQIDKMTQRYREKFIKYRSESIARTEALRAVSVGEYTSQVQAVNDGAIEKERLRRFWVYTRGPKTRQAHREIPSLNPKGVLIDQYFITPDGPLLYPRDPNGSAENIIQ